MGFHLRSQIILIILVLSKPLPVWGQTQPMMMIEDVFAAPAASEINVGETLARMQAEIDSLRMAPTVCCEPIAAAPKFPSVRISGVFQADAGWFSQNAANRVAVDDIQDGADFRRARLQALGSVAENVDYSVEFDFGFPGRPSFMDVWLEVQDLNLLQNVKVGLYRQPVGLDALTSVRELSFIERGLPFAFVPFRQIGAMAHGHSNIEDFTWAVSGFRFPTDFYGSNIGDNGGYGLATRLTGLVIDNYDDQLLHIGGSYCVIDPANDAVRYQTQPEIYIAETGGAAFVPTGVPTTLPPFVDTGVIANTELTNLFSGELATTFGSFHAQSEAIYAVVSRRSESSVGFSGFSAQAAYLLTGEHRPYNRRSAVLGRVVPHRDFGPGGWGAWELASRYSYLDLNDKDIQGGRLSDVTLGLNWYLNQYTKFQMNYIRAMLNSPINEDSHADLVAIRAQLDF